MNQFGYLTWFPEHGLHLIHPDDIERCGDGVQGVVGSAVLAPDGWVCFSFGATSVRVQSQLITPYQRPKFAYGQLVTALPPRSEFTGPIEWIKWHYEQRELYYLGASSK